MSVVSEQSDRALAAIMGCIVSDAAVQPLHWIYNLSKLDSIVGSKKDSLEFWEPSQNPFYSIPTGNGTAYADQLIALVESLVNCEGFDKADFAKRLHSTFGPGTNYDNVFNNAYVQKSGVQKQFPIQGHWRPQVMKDFLANRAEGLENTGSKKMHDMHSVIGVIPIVAMYAGRSEMLDMVEKSLAVTADLDEAVVVGLAAARILEQFILNPSMDGDTALDEVMKQLASSSRINPNDLDRAVVGHLKKVLDKKETEHREAAKNFFLNS